MSSSIEHISSTWTNYSKSDTHQYITSSPQSDTHQYITSSPQKVQSSDGRELFGREVHELYSRRIMPLLLSRASHPMLAVYPTQTLFEEQSDNQWDDIVMMRYRSRRDFLEMITSDEYMQALPLKQDALKKTVIIPSKGFVFPTIHITIVVILLILGFVGRIYFRRKSISKG